VLERVGAIERVMRYLGQGSARIETEPSTCARGIIACFSPEIRHNRSRTGVEVRYARRDERHVISLVGMRPRNSRSRLRIAENSDKIFSH
jgi:hypothetical protein